ncbi:MAG: tetratricopeptide repeat protein, partial [Methanospirillum sp.]|nr:tetratricopeptide repeat protein [Methanospirillum sp.]
GLGQLIEADSAYEAALQLDPRNSMALAGKSKNLVTTGDPETALQSLELAIAADPTNLALLSRQAEIYEKLGRYQDALDVWNSVVINESDPDLARRGKAITLVKAGKRDEALALFHEVLASNPESGILYEQYGDVLALAGNIRGAEESYRKAMDIQPNLTGIVLKIRALESAHNETPFGVFPVFAGLFIGSMLLFKRRN